MMVGSTRKPWYKGDFPRPHTKMLVYKLMNTMITMATMWMLTGDRTYEHDIVYDY